MYCVEGGRRNNQIIPEGLSHSGSFAPFCGVVAIRFPLNDRWVLAINGVDVSEMPVPEATELLRGETVCKDGKIRIKCIDTLSLIFSHPCVATSLGLDRVVGYLIENGTLDPKTKYSQIGADNLSIPLLQVSSRYLPGSLPVFKYLLSVDGADVNATVVGHKSLVHYLSTKLVPSEVLAFFLKRYGHTINARAKNGCTAVNYLVTYLKYRTRKRKNHPYAVPHSLMMDKLRLLLEAGANASICNNSGKTPFDYLDMFEENIDLREIKDGEQLRRDIHEIRALLNRYI